MFAMSDLHPQKPSGKPAPKAVSPKEKKPGRPASAKKEKTPSWWVFTHKSGAFVATASELSERLSRRYGAGVTISHFERMLSEFPQLSPDQKKLVNIDKDIMSLYQAYLDARECRDAERQSFRSRKDVEAVGSALEKVQAFLSSPQRADDGKGV